MHCTCSKCKQLRIEVEGKLQPIAVCKQWLHSSCNEHEIWGTLKTHFGGRFQIVLMSQPRCRVKSKQKNKRPSKFFTARCILVLPFASYGGWGGGRCFANQGPRSFKVHASFTYSDAEIWDAMCIHHGCLNIRAPPCEVDWSIGTQTCSRISFLTPLTNLLHLPNPDLRSLPSRKEHQCSKGNFLLAILPSAFSNFTLEQEF